MSKLCTNVLQSQNPVRNLGQIPVGLMLQSRLHPPGGAVEVSKIAQGRSRSCALLRHARWN